MYSLTLFPQITRNKPKLFNNRCFNRTHGKGLNSKKLTSYPTFIPKVGEKGTRQCWYRQIENLLPKEDLIFPRQATLIYTNTKRLLVSFLPSLPITWYEGRGSLWSISRCSKRPGAPNTPAPHMIKRSPTLGVPCVRGDGYTATLHGGRDRGNRLMALHDSWSDHPLTLSAALLPLAVTS